MGDFSGTNSGGKSSLDIPIFTEEFLHHNKLREAELRQLRKISSEYEEQNAILSKHLENLKAAIEKLELESVQRKATNRNLEDHLNKVTSLVVTQFANIPIPGTTETVNCENVDQYLQRLVDKVTREKSLSAKECSILADKVSKIIAQMD